MQLLYCNLYTSRFSGVDDTLPSVEDKVLLEEMAQLEDSLLGEDGQDEEGEKDGSELGHSRNNDDELLLQMEELM